MEEDNRSVLARKLDYLGARLLILLFTLILFTRFLPPAPGVLLAGIFTYSLHQFLRRRQRQRLTRLAHQRLKNRWWDEMKKHLAAMKPEELAAWVAPYLERSGLSRLACPLYRPGIQLVAFLGREQVAITCFTQTQPVTRTKLEEKVATLERTGVQKILVLASGPFTLEAHRWAQAGHSRLKLLEGDRLLELAWHLQDQPASGEGSGQGAGRPATLAELQQQTHRRLQFGLQSSLYLFLWSLFVEGWLRYYYLAGVLVTLGLLLYFRCFLARYRSLASPSWDTWIAGSEKWDLKNVKRDVRSGKDRR